MNKTKLLTLGLLLIMPLAAFAYNGDPVCYIFYYIFSCLSGFTACALATIAIVIAGYFMSLGIISRDRFICIFVGLSLIIGASYFGATYLSSVS